MKATDWKLLPDPGGYLDQNEALMNDLLTIEWRARILKQHDDLNQMQGNDVIGDNRNE